MDGIHLAYRIMDSMMFSITSSHFPNQPGLTRTQTFNPPSKKKRGFAVQEAVEQNKHSPEGDSPTGKYANHLEQNQEKDNPQTKSDTRGIEGSRPSLFRLAW